MSGPFSPGDVVVCTKSDWRSFYDNTAAPSGKSPVQRGVYRVASVGCDHGIIWVSLDGLEYRWDASFFRKIPPADEQFTEQMRALKPIREGVPA